jgi:hypothetical protein
MNLSTGMKDVERLIRMRDEKIGQLENVNYQLGIFEEKVWEVVGRRRVLTEEFANRTYGFYTRKVSDLLEEKSQIIEDLGVINKVLDTYEMTIWRMVEQPILLPNKHLVLFLLIKTNWTTS